MPNDLKWTQLIQKGDKTPKPRSGHSLTWVGGPNYIMYGGIEDTGGQKVTPCGEVWALKVSPKECRWELEEQKGPLPPSRTQHTALATENKKIFIFGGHASPTARLNDCWYYHTQEAQWERISGDKDVGENQQSAIGAPPPRANCGATLYNNKVYIYGGHGGLKYARTAFSDIYSFDLETCTWHQYEPVQQAQPPPMGRGGNSIFVKDDKLYSYGGWNSETQFTNLIVFDLNTCEWSDPDIFNGVARWNHSSCMVEAIPSWKYFIFGGESTDFGDGQPRSFGSCVNTSCFMDIANMKWQQICPEDEERPSPREYAAMSYDERDRRLLVFGGWNNGWLNDLYALDVSKIVGPSYAITDIDPPLGQISGGVPITIKGVGFKEMNIKVYFTSGNQPSESISKNAVDVPGQFVSETEMTALTPDFRAFGDKREAIIQLTIQGGDLTTTYVPFSFFLDTKAEKSLCHGPGIQEGNCLNERTEFIIQARNENEENRASGRDNFKIVIKTREEEPQEIPYEIEDTQDGKYFVRYTLEKECTVDITVKYEDKPDKWVNVRGSPYSASFAAGSKPDANSLVGQAMVKAIQKKIEEMQGFMKETSDGTNHKNKDLTDVKVLISVKDKVEQVQSQQEQITLMLDQLDESLKYLAINGNQRDKEIKNTTKLFSEWTSLKKLAKDTKKEISHQVENETKKNATNISKLETDLKSYIQDMKKRDFYKYNTGREQALQSLSGVQNEIQDYNDQRSELLFQATKFEQAHLIDNIEGQITTVETEVSSMQILWDHINFCQGRFAEYMNSPWLQTDSLEMEDEVKKLLKKLKEMKVDKRCNAYTGILEEIKKWMVFLPLVGQLRDLSMRDRHWDMIREKSKSDFVIDDKLILKNIYDLNLGAIADDVEEITDQAVQEAKMEKTLKAIAEFWKDIEFDFQAHKGTDVQMIRLSEENFESLEENQTQVTAMFSSRYLATFEDECNHWQKSLAAIAEVVMLCGEVQRTWSFLENLFIHSEEVKKELPRESETFVKIDKEVRRILKDGYDKKLAMKFCNQEWVFPGLEDVQKQLTVCEKALFEFMESKRRAFPRFYFVSTNDLLDILSNGNNPSKVMVHMPKIFQAIDTLELKDQAGQDRPLAVGMKSSVGVEDVKFTKDLQLRGKVENYLQDVIDTMRQSLRDIASDSLRRFQQKPKQEWLSEDPAMVTLLVNMVNWVVNVEKAFQKKGMEQAYKDQVSLLTELILMVQGDLTKSMRQKIMCMITMDAHSRDIILKLHDEQVANADEFQWQSQLKAYWEEQLKDYQLRVADASFIYGYEYLGNGARLVVTPLTDRIYVTATQALHLCMGCAPAGPAGTGKTETTKDLSSACAKAIYVFNCSDQMDYKGMGNIFKGLASSGSWGCFDEFNRLLPSVLSVCSVQFKCVTDAIKAKVQRFRIQDDEISLDPTCGVFITMNPGYLGRAELPEGLKALFRPITVVVPDLELICENMLMAEGFVESKVLAKKFTTLYFLCRDLLSKAAHYDWGLRAIKSVLVVAGAFKRAEPELPEQDLLMRALRDFNLPKIVAEDLEIFFGLLSDLFPGIDPPRKRDMKFEGVIESVAKGNGLFPEPEFILKVVQLGELLEIRHCVFVMGPPGCGKSSTWKTLAESFTKDGLKTMTVDLNPKVVSTDELYGVVHIQTREWIDGLMSSTMRRLGQIPDQNKKWIILDGDLDANWIESMNSVMDDNKILTLASNERIPLKAYMRLIFEIRNLKFATPATVSRAGILFISDFNGYQWRAYVQSWIAKMNYDKDRKHELQTYFNTYVEEALPHIRRNFKYLIPVVEISMVVSLCKLLESILKTSEVKGLAYVFVFCTVWCLGGGFDEKDGKQYRKEFSNWWKDKFKAPRFPTKGSVFDYYVDIEKSTFEEWSKLNTQDVSSTIDTTKSIAQYTVPTQDTIAVQFLMKKFLQVNHSPLLIGQAGCGKTQITKGLLNELTTTTDEYLQQIVNFNYFTDSALLQNILEQQLEKRAGRTYGPVGKYKLVYFIDDLNMPMLDKYETQSAIALVRQHKDYEHWYDRAKLTLKDIKSTLYVAAMNPTAGSFVVNPRLQRHFWLQAIQFPETQSLFVIFSTFLNKHFNKFKSNVQELLAPLIKSTLSLHQDVERTFRKTAINFHYEFNVRHLTNVFQGVLQAKQDAIKEPDNLVKLWVHECERIYGDRLVNAANLATFRGNLFDNQKKTFPRTNLANFFKAEGPEPLVFANFVASLDDKLYDQFPNADVLTQRLHEALREYNDTNAVMDLVLFSDAMKHVCKISRIISNDGGHALLVGVGGSGKQSLSRLSSFISQFTTMSIMISSTYGIGDLKVDLQKMYNKTGLKDEGVMFLFTEGQITNERFLVFINDLLSSGEIADLYPAEDVDNIVNGVRNAVKSEGLIDNKDNCWKFFIDRVRKNLHMSLCFSPVGESFRNRSRRFPAIINNTVIDWFHPWPQEALLSVATKFLEEIEMPSDEVRDAIIKFMPYSFGVVDEASEMIKTTERRFVYTTPKSFLELIKLFKTMLEAKSRYLENEQEKYEVGVGKLQQTEEIVTKLEADLKIKSVEVEELKTVANKQATVVGAEKEIVDKKAAEATIESDKANKIADEVGTLLASVQADLDNAIPLVEKAKAALAGLKVQDFQVLKALNNPPAAVKGTFFAAQNLLAGINEDIPVSKTGKITLKFDDSWKLAQKQMQNPQKFMDILNEYKTYIDEDRVPANNFKAIQSTLDDPEFTPEILISKAAAAAGVCDWIRNIALYYDVVVNVEPKKRAVAAAKIKLEEANKIKDEMNALVAELTAKLAVLQEQYQAAMDAKQGAEDEAARCASRLDLANRLVSSLGSEKERWAQSIIRLGEEIQVVTGDVLLASSFVSYVGPFNKKYRDYIINDRFVKFFKQHKIPVSESCNPLDILTTEATTAGWCNDKLPSDRVSIENGSILTNSERYTLMIDPQLQGITWIKEREKKNDLKVTRLSNPKMIKTLEFSIEGGQPVLIENLMNSIDAVIQPVYARAIIKRGKSKYIKMGDKELSLHNQFNLYLHTKLSNPHYPPEIQAECTLINFTVTEAGLEDQILSLVVKKERPDLAAQREFLIQQQNQFKIQLSELEADLLKRLAEQKGDILDDIELIENLEKSKAVSEEVKEKVKVAKETEISIVEASETYRPAANRGALVFFMMNELYKIHSFYRFSLDSFVIVVNRAIDIVAERMNPKKTEPNEGEDGEKEEGEEEGAEPDNKSAEEEEAAEMTPRTLAARVNAILDSITYEGFNYTRRGTREVDKLTIATMLTLRINVRKGLILENEVASLVKKEVMLDPPTQPENLKFIPEAAWAAVKGLERIKLFETLGQNMESEALSWKKWYGDEKAELCELPKAYRSIELFHRILLLRALRPDRLSGALIQYVTESLGEEFIEQPSFDPFVMFKETSTITPAFFVLYPGVDPTPDVERVGATMGKSITEGSFINISMGQGQEDIAINALKNCAKKGNWIMVQNVHLMTEWMKVFERQLEIAIEEDCHPDFRCFISSEPPGLPHMEIIPESILQNSIKVSNEAPQDLKANMRRALSKFDEAYFDKAKSHKYQEFKALIFGLCTFHSLILGRRKFGSQGWSKHYNFNDGDLRICGDVLHNYLSKYDKVPYEDLRYIYGEIMYGGHITDNWDRRTNNTYLEVILRPEIMQQMQLTLQPGFKSPDPVKFEREQYRLYIEQRLPVEQPQMFGLHPNAEIGYLTTKGESLFDTILSISGGSGGSGASGDEITKELIDKFLKELPENFHMLDIQAKIQEKTPYLIVAIQESERMNGLLSEIRFSLTELDLGLKGALNITDMMEGLSHSLQINKVPDGWAAKAYFSKKTLAEWFTDLLQRVQQLVDWTEDAETPNVLWIAGLFNPMSYLTAIMQVTARAKNLPLDDICLRTDIKNTFEAKDFTAFAEEGAYINGFFLEGAGWECGRGEEQGYLVDMVLKELHPVLPVMHVLAIRRSERKTVGIYECPVYVTSGRGPTYVFTSDLQMESEESDANKWILAGCALLMSPE